MITTQEASQYIRLTLRQHRLEDVSFSFKDMPRSLGYFHLEENTIVLSTTALKNFPLFKETLLHEICHKLDILDRGTFKNKNGRNDFHGKNWKKHCKNLGIPARRFIPANFN